MKVFGVTVPTVEQMMYRPGIDPRLDRITKVALAVIGATSAAALFVFSAKIIVPCALAASLVAWLFPLFVGAPPNYEAVAGYGITKESMADFMALAEDDNDFTTFIAFLETFNTQVVESLKEAHLFQVLNPILQMGVDKDKISSEVLAKIAPLFSEHGILNATDFKPNIDVIAKDGSTFRCNKTVLLMSSAYFGRMLRSGSQEAAENKIRFPELSGPTVQGLVHFLTANGEPIELDTETYLHLLNFADLAGMEALSRWAKGKLFDLAAQCEDKANLSKFLQGVDITLSTEADHTYVNWLISKALTCFLKKNYGFTSNFQYTKTLFTMPIEALGLLNDPGVIGDYLRGNVNCIAVERVFGEDVFVKLTTVLSLLSNEQKAKLTALKVFGVFKGNEAFFERILKLFPSIKRACLTLSSHKYATNCSTEMLPCLKFFQDKQIGERALVFDPFYDSTPATFIIGTYFPSHRRVVPLPDPLVEIIKAATLIDNFTETTRIALDTFRASLNDSRNGTSFADEFKELLRQRLPHRLIQRVNLHPEGDEGYLTVTFDV